MASRKPSELPLAALAGGKIVTIDVGGARMGVAVSNNARTVALPRGIWPAPWAQLKMKLAEEKQAGCTLVVLGLPLNMDGTYGPMATKVTSLADLIEKELALPVLLWDERLTSRQMEAAFFEQRAEGREGRRQTRATKKESVGHTDAGAATLILQGVLDALASR
jgi:putative Holliday junction resolvase